MKCVSRTIFTLVLLWGLLAGTTAKAESFPGGELPGEFNSLFALLEPFISGGFPSSSVLSMGGCQPTMTYGFPYVNFNFANTVTCKISGDITLWLWPFKIMVHLDVYDQKIIEGIDFDISILFRREGDIRYITLLIQNGRLAVRPTPEGPLKELMINGLGLRATKKRVGYTGQTRMNIFDNATGNGFAMLKTVSKVYGESKSKKIERCDLTGADINDLEAGVISNCITLVDK